MACRPSPSATEVMTDSARVSAVSGPVTASARVVVVGSPSSSATPNGSVNFRIRSATSSTSGTLKWWNPSTVTYSSSTPRRGNR